jgi:hypothetical protein
MRYGILLGLAAFLAPAAAGADASRLEALVAKEGKLCFARIYDAAHLATHPRQKIERVFVMLGRNKAATYWEDPDLRHSEESPRKQAQEESGAGGSDYMATLLTLRGAKKPEMVSGWCGRVDAKAKALDCGGECDRHIGALRGEDDDHLVFDDVPRGLLSEEEGETTQKALELGVDDKSFRLERRPIDDCVTEANKTNSPYAALGRPLRERLAADQPFCFGRDYGPDHLAAHPKQLTTSIRVFRDARSIDADRAKNLLPDWPDGATVKASVTTRANGKPATLVYSCAPFEDQWECAAHFCKAGEDAACAAAERENARATACAGAESRIIYLRRGAKDLMMLGNPDEGLRLDASCKTPGKTMTDDRTYRLEPMPLSACDSR